MLPSFNCGFTAVGQDGVILDPEQGAQTIPENMVALSPPRVSGLAEERDGTSGLYNARQTEPRRGYKKTEGNLTRPRAADDFATIRARMEELRRERARPRAADDFPAIRARMEELLRQRALLPKSGYTRPRRA